MEIYINLQFIYIVLLLTLIITFYVPDSRLSYKETGLYFLFYLFITLKNEFNIAYSLLSYKDIVLYFYPPTPISSELVFTCVLMV